MVVSHVVKSKNLTHHSSLSPSVVVPHCCSAEDVSGTIDDVIRIARKLLNRSVVSRLIPKQECMVELDKLPLVLCTETIESISLSGSYKLTSNTHQGLVSRYRKIAAKQPETSLNDLFNQENRNTSKIVIPHWIGGRGQPTYPVTKDYARMTLLVHRPWKATTPPRISKEQWIQEFNQFLDDPECPQSVKIAYTRVRERKIKKRQCEPTAEDEECYDHEAHGDVDDETRDILNLVKTNAMGNDPELNVGDFKFDRGINYNWSQRAHPERDPMIEGGTWLQDAIDSKDDKDWSPFTTEINGQCMNIDASMARDDQQEVLLTVMSKVKEWVECATTHNASKAQSFKPLYLTVQGCAGSGKSFFIKCLVNTMRDTFGQKNVVHVVGPTGAAAWSVGGQTMHRKFGINPHNPSSPPSTKQKDRMKEDNKFAIVYVLDERSMYTADNLGAAERNAAASAHGGGHEGELFGGIPIFILVGDDYQLPPPTNTQKGAFDTMGSQPSISQQKTGVAATGAQLFLDLSEKCMALTTTKRQKSDQQNLIEILGRLRVGESIPTDADTLMEHHFTNFSNTDIESITSTGTTMHLFANKKPRNEFNYQKLQQITNASNPVALIKTKWESTSGKPAVCKAHFQSHPITASILSKGAMVCLIEKNFEPEWSLFNNSIGEVEEIVFRDGDNPNNGDQPCYIAVKFPQYSGPAWDPQKPKVSTQ